MLLFLQLHPYSFESSEPIQLQMNSIFGSNLPTLSQRHYLVIHQEFSSEFLSGLDVDLSGLEYDQMAQLIAIGSSLYTFDVSSTPGGSVQVNSSGYDIVE